MLVAGALLTPMFFNGSPVLFIQSRESKTVDGHAVFNRIRLISSTDKDVWMMNQSHYGSMAKAGDWDRLAIVVDKTRSPKVAQFYQFEPGPLEWKEGMVTKPLRVSCFLCHSNGPRAIRPDFQSSVAGLSLIERGQTFVWNLRIKAYGRILPHPDLDRPTSETPFRFQGKLENQRLSVATCMHCHQESGLFARGELRRQNAIAIQFMVSSGAMPPLGMSLSEQEKKSIDEFIAGF